MIQLTGVKSSGGAGFCEGTRLSNVSWRYLPEMASQKCPQRPFSIHDPGPAHDPNDHRAE